MTQQTTNKNGQNDSQAGKKKDPNQNPDAPKNPANPHQPAPGFPGRDSTVKTEIKEHKNPGQSHDETDTVDAV